MPPLTYPDQITYYGFCKTDNPYARKAFPHNPVDPEEVLRQANEINAWVTASAGEISDEDFEARAKHLEESLAQRAIATGRITLAACGHDCMGNARPYDVEGIYEPLYRGINLNHRDMPLYLRVLTEAECLLTWRAFLELSRHPFFEHDPEGFDDILHVFRSLKTFAKDADWIVIGMMRSYYLHNG